VQIVSCTNLAPVYGSNPELTYKADRFFKLIMNCVAEEKE
jgi:hypothetical protein